MKKNAKTIFFIFVRLFKATEKFHITHHNVESLNVAHTYLTKTKYTNATFICAALTRHINFFLFFFLIQMKTNYYYIIINFGEWTVPFGKMSFHHCKSGKWALNSRQHFWRKKNRKKYMKFRFLQQSYFTVQIRFKNFNFPLVMLMQNTTKLFWVNENRKKPLILGLNL